MKVPRRVAFFASIVVLGKILTSSEGETGVVIMDWCCMCNGSEVTVDHLLLNCELTQESWSLALVKFGLHWSMPRLVTEMFVVLERIVWDSSEEYGLECGSLLHYVSHLA